MGKTLLSALSKIEKLGKKADSDSVRPKLYDYKSKEKLEFEEGKFADSALVRLIDPFYEILKIFFQFWVIISVCAYFFICVICGIIALHHKDSSNPTMKTVAEFCDKVYKIQTCQFKDLRNSENDNNEAQELNAVK